MRRLTLAVALAALPSAILAQAPPNPTFEVAAIRPSTGDKASLDVTEGGRFSAIRVTVLDLIQFAYPVGGATRHDDQIVGGPAWVRSDRFDVVATGGPAGMPRPPAGTVDSTPSVGLNIVRDMVRQLLNDRFTLTVHHENRRRPVYILTRAKADALGPQLRKSLADCCGGFKRSSEGSLAANAITMPMLATMLSSLDDIGRPVEDRSDLSGPFDLELTWAASTADAPSIFTAMREQLGLKLESTTGVVDVLVIDRAERPTEN